MKKRISMLWDYLGFYLIFAKECFRNHQHYEALKRFGNQRIMRTITRSVICDLEKSKGFRERRYLKIAESLLKTL